MRKRSPKSTALIFSSGKMIVLGTKTVQDSNTAAYKFTKDISKALSIKLKIDQDDIEIVNIAANF